MRYVLIFIFSLSCCFAFPNNFTQAKKDLIEIYKQINQPQDFYCNTPFKIVQKSKYTRLELLPSNTYAPRNKYTKKGKLNQRAMRIEWEHIMPAENFGKHLPCWKEGGRRACAKDPIFQKMEADIHNIVPAIGEINGDRSNFRYAQAPKNLKYTQYGNCKVYTDFKAKRFYPADYSKGRIARAYLYMSKTYNIRLSTQERKLMEAWNKTYPISKWEQELDKKIRKLYEP